MIFIFIYFTFLLIRGCIVMYLEPDTKIYYFNWNDTEDNIIDDGDLIWPFQKNNKNNQVYLGQMIRLKS